MAKKKVKPIPLKSEVDVEAARRRWRVMRHGLAILLVAGGAFLCVSQLKDHVEKRLTFPTAPPTVVLKNRPAWMSELLASQIAETARPHGVHSAFDHQMLVTVTDKLRNNPWIRKVNQVRRAYGQRPGDTLEVDCEYRAPIALVHWKDYYWLVDGEGIKLPEQYTGDLIPRIISGRDRRTHIRVIEGVDRPPPETGQKWTGEDLAAGLGMVKQLYGLSYADEIVRVDVSNFAGRVDTREAQVVLRTKYDTEIRWGRPLDAPDYFIEVSAARKLDYLRKVYNEFRRIDGGKPWLDIRFDKITYPSSEADVQQASSQG